MTTGASLVIDGQTIMNDNTWNTEPTFQVTLGPGIAHLGPAVRPGQRRRRTDLRLLRKSGVAYNTQGNTGTDGEWVQMGATDTEGDTSFLAELPGAPNSPIVMSIATTLDLSTANSLNLVALGSLADASSGVTGQKVLVGAATRLPPASTTAIPRSPA